jgi:hypothetical protein
MFFFVNFTLHNHLRYLTVVNTEIHCCLLVHAFSVKNYRDLKNFFQLHNFSRIGCHLVVTAKTTAISLQLKCSPLSCNSKGQGKAIPVLAWTGPEGSWRFRLPEVLDNQYMKVVRLSA